MLFFKPFLKNIIINCYVLFIKNKKNMFACKEIKSGDFKYEFIIQ